MIKAFDKQNLNQLRADLDTAFASIREKYGITISLGNISYAPDKATSKLTMIATGDSTNVNDPNAARLAASQADFKRYAKSFGLKPEQFGTIFKFGRDSYKLVGLKPRAGKRPILAQQVQNGTVYVLPESAIAALQSDEYKKLYGITTPTQASNSVLCSNTKAFDANWKPIGKCTRPATTSRQGFSLEHGKKQLPYCEECARLVDEARAEMRAEGRAS